MAFLDVQIKQEPNTVKGKKIEAVRHLIGLTFFNILCYREPFANILELRIDENRYLTQHKEQLMTL